MSLMAAAAAAAAAQKICTACTDRRLLQCLPTSQPGCRVLAMHATVDVQLYQPTLLWQLHTSDSAPQQALFNNTAHQYTYNCKQIHGWIITHSNPAMKKNKLQPVRKCGFLIWVCCPQNQNKKIIYMCLKMMMMMIRSTKQVLKTLVHYQL